MRTALAAVLLLTSASLAHAQGWGAYNERNHSAAQVNRSAAQLADDRADLQRFRMTLAAFDAAVQRGDAFGVRRSLQSFVQQGRAELAEQQRETMQADREAAGSAREAWRDRNPRDYRDARDDRRYSWQQRGELAEVNNLLAELERLASAEITFGPQQGVLMRSRQIMVRFCDVAARELRRSHRELREDMRELREDQRGMRRGYGPGARPPYGGPYQPGVVVTPPPPPVYRPAPPVYRPAPPAPVPPPGYQQPAVVPPPPPTTPGY